MSEEMLNIDTIQQKYSTDGVHLLLPNVHLEQVTPLYKLSVVYVEADLSPNSGDVFKIGSAPKKDEHGNDVKKGDKTVFEPVYSPAKPLLMKIATAAGIQFDPDRTAVSIESRYMYTGKACGAIRLPDGSFRTLADIKVIDLSPEEDRQQLLLMDKAAEGLTGTEAWNASKMYKGEWKKAIDGEDKKSFMIDPEDRKSYIDRQLLINMIQLRKDAPQKALTGAMLRVVRALIGMKGQYTESELKKPFVLARVNFSPDFNDPSVKKAMFEQGIASSYNVFGGRGIPSCHFIDDDPIEVGFETLKDGDNSAAVATPPDPVIPKEPAQSAQPAKPVHAAQPVRPLPVPDIPPAQENPATKSSKTTSGGSKNDPKKSEPPKGKPAPVKENPPDGNTCVKCGKAGLSDSVVKYSFSHFNMVLCFNCGKEEEKKRAEGKVA